MPKCAVRNPQVLHVYLTDVWLADPVSETRAIFFSLDSFASGALGIWAGTPHSLVPLRVCSEFICTLIISVSGFVQTLFSSNCEVVSVSDLKMLVLGGSCFVFGVWVIWRPDGEECQVVGISGSWGLIYLSSLS